MDPLLWAPADSLILNNFINVNRSYAHINEKINSLGLVALQLMICNKQCKMLSNFVPSKDTLPRRSENQAQVSQLGGNDQEVGERRLCSWLEACPGRCRQTPLHSAWECSRRHRHNSPEG